MIEGLNTISNLLRLYKIKESLYLRSTDISIDPFAQAVEELYANIFEYQARAICHLCLPSLKRGVRGTFKLDDWEGMLKKVQTSDDACTRYSILSDKKKEEDLYNKQTSQILQSVAINQRILDIFKASQARIQQDRRDDREAELLETLASDYKSDKDPISTRVPGTCEWFFEDDRFLKWRDSQDSRLLWVSAGPGCEKSVLSRALVDERRVCTNAMASTVCYFFFKDGQEQRILGTDALSAILHQLFENTALLTYALPSYKNYGNKLRDAFSELWDILVRLARDSEVGEVICVLDALDECEQNARKQLMAKLVDFFSRMEPQKKSSFVLKFLITSRPYDHVEQEFQRLSGAGTFLHFDGDDKSQRIGQEINLVIDAKIPSIAGDFSERDRQRISQRLKKMDNRTYLWLFLTIDIIVGSQSNFRKVSSIESLLSDLPLEITDAYERILNRSSDKIRARILLQLIVAARRPLSLEECNVALTLATQEGDCISHKALDLWPLPSFKSTIQNICGLFVSVHDGKISLIHQTAREFLIRSTKQPDFPPDKWQGCLNITMAHGTISQVCLDYLNLNDFAGVPPSRLNPDDDRQQRNQLYLLEYTALNWAVHYTSQDNRGAKDSRKAAQRLCNEALSQQSCWFPTYCESSYLEFSGWTELAIASLLGLIFVVEDLCAEGAEVNAQGGDFGNALQAASEGGHDQVVQILLDKGAEVNAQGGYYSNALQAASYRGHDQVVQILLDKGAEINAQGGNVATLCRRRYLEVTIRWYRYYSTREPRSTLKVEAMATLCRRRHIVVTIKWYRYYSTTEPRSTLKVDTMATLCRRRHIVVTIKWYRYYSTTEPRSTLKVDTMATLCRRRHMMVTIRWCRCCWTRKRLLRLHQA